MLGMAVVVGGGDQGAPGATLPDARKGLRGLVSRRTVLMAGLFLVAVFLFLLGFYIAGLMGLYNLPYLLGILQAFVLGAENTLVLVVIVIPVGFGAGFLFGWGRTSPRWLVRSISTMYVEFFRSMPPIVLIAFAFLIVTTVVLSNSFLKLRIEDLNSFAQAMAALGLALHSGGYQAEIVRAGILSVPTGQREAAESIGLSKGRIMGYVVLPQMFRVSLPALGNEFASVIKDTSLLSAVGILELTFQGFNLSSRCITTRGCSLDNILLVWFSIALIYFLMTFIVSRSLQGIERRYRVPGLEAAQL